MHRLEEASSGEVRQTPRIIAIGLVGGERLERLVGLSAFDAHHGKAQLAEPMRPVSKTIRRQLGAFDDSTAIAAAVDSDLLS